MIGEKSAIFVDTNAFERNGFNFDDRNKLISIFKKILEKGKYLNVSVSVVDNEIKKHINDKIEENKRAIKKHCKWMYDIADHKQINEKLNKNLLDYEKFKNDTNTININLSNINPENVMSKYFELKPPFELNKQYEFKDAFFLESIYEFANSNDTYLSFIVITNDNGIKKAIDEQKNKKIIYFDSISELIDSIINYNDESKKELFDYLSKYDFDDQIQEQLKINVMDIEEFEIDIDDYMCGGIFLPKIIKKTCNSITVICDMYVNLMGDFKCLDYNKSYYSSEEKDYIYKEYKERRFLSYICQTIIEVKVNNGNFSTATIVDLPDIDIDYESFMNVEDYLEQEKEYSAN